jgi:hypothetical protein
MVAVNIPKEIGILRIKISTKIINGTRTAKLIIYFYLPEFSYSLFIIFLIFLTTSNIKWPVIKIIDTKKGINPICNGINNAGVYEVLYPKIYL